MNEAIKMSPTELISFLEKAFPALLPVLISGSPGIGKSDIIARVAKMLGMALIISHPAVEDPTNTSGLPWMNAGDKHANFMLFGEAYDAFNATKPTVWLWDDFGQANNAVQAAKMQVLLGRRINSHRLPDCVTIVAATNGRKDRSGVGGLLEAVKSRFSSIVELEPSLQDWCLWAIQSGFIPPSLIAFLRFQPQYLSDFQPTADLTNSPSPRTWGNVAKLEALGLAPATESKAFAGAVGLEASTQYLAFKKLYASLVSLDAILLNPDSAPIPTAPDQLYAVSCGLAMKANKTNFGRIATYAERMLSAKKGEFATLMIRDAQRKTPEVAYTEAFTKLNSGEFGQLIAGM